MTARTIERAPATPAAGQDFQVAADVAEVYEREFVPALFADWARQLVDAVGVRDGERLLDVACGTGVVARTAADRAPGAVVQGVDLNPAMLAVARRLRPDLGWRQGDVGALPYGDGELDVVTCQAALMFFPDPVAALAEMARVTRPEGRVGLLVVGRLAYCPAYVRLAEVLERRAGSAVAELVRGYFALGEPDRLTGLLAAGGLVVERWSTTTTGFRRPSVGEFVRTEVGATPVGARLDESLLRAVVADAERELRGLVDVAPDHVSVPIEAHVVVARPSPSGARR